MQERSEFRSMKCNGTDSSSVPFHRTGNGAKNDGESNKQSNLLFDYRKIPRTKEQVREV